MCKARESGVEIVNDQPDTRPKTGRSNAPWRPNEGSLRNATLMMVSRLSASAIGNPQRRQKRVR